MENDSFSHAGMMNWDNGWHWLASFHGVLLIVSLAIIVAVGIALIRDWRRKHVVDPDLSPSERRLQR